MHPLPDVGRNVGGNNNALSLIPVDRECVCFNLTYPDKQQRTLRDSPLRVSVSMFPCSHSHTSHLTYLQVEAVETGCRGCSSGKAGYANIFGNKYGQYLATVQYMREVQAGLIDAPETRTEQKKKAKKKSKKRKVRVSV